MKNKALLEYLKIVDVRTGIINSLVEVGLHHDDPLVFSFGTSMPDTTGFLGVQCNLRNGGASINREQAAIAAIGESVERYCSAYCDNSSLIFDSYKNLKYNAVHPDEWVLFSDNQYSSNNFPFERFTENTKIGWVKGVDISNEREILVPACFTFLPYKRFYDEPNISPIISTGLSCRNNLDSAILYGAFECIERDAFTIYWLNKLSKCPNVGINFIGEKSGIAEVFTKHLKKNGLKYIVWDITLDIPIPTYFSVSIGESNIGKKLFCVGTATNLEGEKALLKSLVETAQQRPYLRYEYFKNPDWTYLNDFSDVNSFDDHGKLYSFDNSLLEKLSFCTEENGTINNNIINRSLKSDSQNLETVVSLLKEKGFRVIYVDLTTPEIKDLGLTVTRVLVPGLQPLHGDHRLPFLGGNRLYEIPNSLNLGPKIKNEHDLFPYPHPFP